MLTRYRSPATFTFAALLMSAAFSTFANASVTWLTQTRYVTAGADGVFGPAVGETISATGFGPFHAQAIAAPPFEPNDGQIILGTSMHSSIFADSMSASGSFTAMIVPPAFGFHGTIEQEALVEVTFHIDSLTPYYMRVDALTGAPSNNAQLGLRLYSSSGVNPIDGVVWPQQPSVSGILSPGNYRLRSAVNSFNVGSNFDYSWVFAVPTPSTAAILGLGSLIATRRRR